MFDVFNNTYPRRIRVAAATLCDITKRIFPALSSQLLVFSFSVELIGRMETQIIATTPRCSASGTFFLRQISHNLT